MTNAVSPNAENVASPWPPSLPPGYLAQAVSGFRDPDGRLSYELFHVYAAADPADARGPVMKLDEKRSYWSVSWTDKADTAAARLSGRSLSYAQACQQHKGRLGFDDFGSFEAMKGALATG